MSTAKITSKGQITIPKEVRTRLGVASGDRVEFVEINEGVFQIVAATQDVKLLKGIVPKPEKPVTVEEPESGYIGNGRISCLELIPMSRFDTLFKTMKSNCPSSALHQQCHSLGYAPVAAP